MSNLTTNTWADLRDSMLKTTIEVFGRSEQPPASLARPLVAVRTSPLSAIPSDPVSFDYEVRGEKVG